MGIRNTAVAAIAATTLLLTVGCSQAPPPEPPDTRTADEAAIRKLDADWSNAAAAKQLDAVVAYYADGATVMPPNEPTVTDKEGIKKSWSALLTLPNSSLHWETTKVGVARSGDLGYSEGTYEFTFDDAKGKPLRDHGKYLAVWKKQADGNWKSVSDT